MMSLKVLRRLLEIETRTLALLKTLSIDSSDTIAWIEAEIAKIEETK